MFNEKEYNRLYARRYRAANRNRIREKSRAYSKRYYQQNKQACNRASLDAKFKRKFGLTIIERDSLIAMQDNKCKVCDRLFSPRNRACVDHDHLTGQMRGIICTSCNKALGLLQDSLATLRRAMTYLQGQ